MEANGSPVHRRWLTGAPLRWWAEEQLPKDLAIFLTPALPLQWLWVLVGHW